MPQSSIKGLLLPDGTAVAQFSINPMRRRSFNHLQDFGKTDGPIGRTHGHQRQMNVVGHYNDRM